MEGSDHHLLLSKFSILINGDQTTLEVTEMQLGTTGNLDLGDLFCMLLQLSSGSDSVCDMFIIVSVSGDSETNKVKNTLTLLLILLIPLEGERTKLARTDTIETDHLNAETDTTKVINLHVSALEEVSHIKIDSMTTRRHHNTLHTSLDHIDSKLTHLEATGVHVLGEENLTKTNGESKSITTADTTVSRVTITKSLDLLEHETDVLAKQLGEALLEETVMTEAEHTTHVAKTILLGAHGEDIAIAEHLTDDITKSGTVGAIRLLELLDEPSILSKASSIKENRDTKLVSDLVNSTEVSHAYRLTGSSVVGDSDENERDVLVFLLHHLLAAIEIDVALEGILSVDLVSIEGIEEVRSEEILRDEAVSGSLSLSGIKETVRRDHPRLGDTTLLEGAANRCVKEGLSAATLTHDEHVRSSLTLLTKNSKGMGVSSRGILSMTDPPLISPVVTSASSDQAAALRRALCRISRKSVESVTDSVGNSEEAIVATDRLITTNDGSPLGVSHSSRTTVRKVIDDEHSSGERECVVFSGIKHSLTILLCDLVGLADDESVASRLDSAELLLIQCGC